MENIRQALERARSVPEGARQPLGGLGPSPNRVDPRLGVEPFINGGVQQSPGQVIALDRRHLESNRIIAHDEMDVRSKSFDMLRTQVLQSMDQRSWKILGITSPSPNCGKTLTAINLAMSIARQPERVAMLADLDLQKPQVANCLGVPCKTGLLSVLRGQANLSSALVRADAGACQITVLPIEASAPDSSAWVTSRAMSALLQEMKKDYRSHTIILDLPPMLSSDDVIALLPQIDCVLLVAAIGATTVAEIDECNRHLQSAQVVRIVLNKVPQSKAGYYPY
jgi:protein-tyrosine kinase